MPLPLRVFVLAMIAFGMIIQPFFASIGEVHLLTHYNAGMSASQHGPHAQADHADEPGHGNPAPVDEETLHALMHHAQYCGQVGALGRLRLYVPSMAPAASKPVMTEARHVVLAPTLAPFRPPIAA